MQEKAKFLRGMRRAVSLMLAAVLLLSIPTAGAEIKHGVVTVDKVLFRKEAVSNADHWGYLNIGWAAEILGRASGSGYEWLKVKTNLPDKLGTYYTGYVRSDVFRLMSSEEEVAWLNNPVQGAHTWQSGSGSVVTPTPTPVSSGGITVPVGESSGPSLSSVAGYVRITKTLTNLRDRPDGGSILQLEKNVILPYYGQEIPRGTYKWIYILDTKTSNYGYVRSDCYQFVTETGTPTSGPGSEVGGVTTMAPIVSGSYAMITVDAANLRQTPGGYGLIPLPAGAVVQLTGSENAGWYPVSYNGYTGYVSTAHLRVMTSAEVANYLAGTLPGGSAQPPATGSDGYVRITAVRVNLRDRPDGVSMLQMDKDQIIPYYGAPQYRNGTGWLYVYYTPARVYGYVHQDFYQYTNASGTTVPATTITPPPSVTVGPISGYVKLTKDKVNLRVTPGGESLLQLSIHAILPYEGAPTYSGGYSWVRVQDPISRRFGFVRSDCYVFTDSAGNPVSGGAPTPLPEPSVAPTSMPGTAGGTLTLIKGGVNLRTEPGGPIIARLDRGATMPYYGFAQKDGYTWYYVLSDKGAGYIRSDMANISGTPGLPQPTTGPELGASGYLITTKSNVNLRKTPGGLTLTQVEKAKVYPITGPIVSQGGYSWYFVKTEGNTGYLRGDCVRQLTQPEVDAYLLNGTIPPLTGPSGGGTPATGHITILQNGVNIRVSPSLDAGLLGQVPKDTVLPYKNSLSSGGNMWYQVEYNGLNGYVLGNLARIMTLQEYQAWLAGQPVPTQVPATATPRPEDYSTTAVTLKDRVLVRKTGSMAASTLTVLYKAGARAELLGATAQSDGYTWYNVRAGGVNGWIRGDMLRILTKAEAGSGTTPSVPGGKPVAVYRTLRKGMSGEDVVRLQNQLIALGLMPAGSANGVYNTQTELAVREYQKVEKLFVDGVAGQKTQDALYGTVAPDAPSGGSTVDTTIYPVEIVDWYTGDIQTLWNRGDVATITDVYTGISFRAKRWAGGYHSDAEPLTAADTAAICRIYGVKSAQEISDKNLYQRRPLWVTIKGRTIAASLYGVPHNYPAGDTIRDNDFNGQFCVHFYNSRTHSSGRVDADHMKAIQYAYDKAPSKK